MDNLASEISFHLRSRIYPWVTDMLPETSQSRWACRIMKNSPKEWKPRCETDPSVATWDDWVGYSTGQSTLPYIWNPTTSWSSWICCPQECMSVLPAVCPLSWCLPIPLPIDLTCPGALIGTCSLSGLPTTVPGELGGWSKHPWQHSHSPLCSWAIL